MPRPGNYTATSIDPEGLHFDFRNNVVYNWKGNEPGYNADKNATSRYNFIGNVYITGPESSVRNKVFKESCVDASGYFEDNSYNGVVPDDQWSLVTFSGFNTAQIAAYKARSYLVPMESVTTTSPAQAKDQVLASAGASIPRRDTIDYRIVNDILLGTGHSIATTAEQPEGAWPVLYALPAPVDNDHDGMPNDWEWAHNLDPNNATDRNNIGLEGYTQLEVYLNSLTGEIVTHSDDVVASLPRGFLLGQNYPNPFNSSTMTNYQLPIPSEVELGVYNLLGQKMITLVSEKQPAGTYKIKWHAKNLSSGTYLVRLEAEDYTETRKLILQK